MELHNLKPKSRFHTHPFFNLSIVFLPHGKTSNEQKEPKQQNKISRLHFPASNEKNKCFFILYHHLCLPPVVCTLSATSTGRRSRYKNRAIQTLLETEIKRRKKGGSSWILMVYKIRVTSMLSFVSHPSS